ncbi:MAG: 2-dehydropantoate 2-reductase [Nocardioides sp.]|nr:2-dehydropantoate 2-reductase [Nocardioides sp.]
MRYVVYGAGAVGGGVGGLLHRAGLPVTLVARGEHLATMRRDGLALQVGHTSYVVRPALAGSAAEVDWDGEPPVVLLCVKSQQTHTALADLAPYLHRARAVVSLQNGVANERTLLRHHPHVHGVTVMMPASHLAPGQVVLHSANRPALLDVGRYPAGTDQVDDQVAADLRAAGFESVPRADVMAWKHRKLVLNLGNAVDALCPDEGADGEAADELVRRARAEGEEVLAAAGVPVVSQEDDLARRGQLLRPLVDRGPGHVGSSTWQSVSRGTGDAEADFLNGEVVLQARLAGREVPVNALLQAELAALVREGRPPRSVSARGLLERLDG